ncbi:MAG: ketoacyl-ACP synthase III [Raoultibacter sp.]|jgi:3-oxoacyl-[acyl-carrier-protein] synthase-3
MPESKSRISGFGAYVPEKVLNNADLEKMVDTSNEWIVQRTGIHERRIADAATFASDLAIKAVEDLVSRNSIDISDVDLVIVTSFTPDHFTPTISGLVQGHFGIKGAGSFDLNSGCTGFAYAVSTADALITAGVNKKILIVAAEMLSKIVDYEDRSTCILFGDGAAACVLERTEDAGSVLARHFETDGDLAHYVYCGNQSDTVQGMKLERQNIFGQNGQQVYKYVMKHVPDGFAQLLANANITGDDIDWFIPHSANMRIIQALGSRLSMPDEKTLTSIECFGNTSSASIPLALWLAQKEGKLNQGDLLVMYGFGGGLTHGGVVVRI